MTKLLSILLASSLLLFAACGKGGESDGCAPATTAETPSDTPAKAGETREVSLTIDGMS